MKHNQIVILIPAYNPTIDLVSFSNSLINNSFKIVIVNDGSSAESLDIFKKLNNKILVLQHEKNLGKGEALKTGFKYILENIHCEGVITADADGQHTINDIISIADKMENNVLTLGSRFNTSNMPNRSKFRKYFNKICFQISFWYKYL